MSESVAVQDDITKIDNEDNAKKAKKDKKDKKKNKKKDKKKKGKKGLFTYLKETKAELKKVSWASKSKTIKDSMTVMIAIAIAVIFSLFIDSGISFFLKVLIK